MTSDSSYTSKRNDIPKEDAASVCTQPDTISARLLSPIIEQSVEIYSTSLPIEQICLDSTGKSPPKLSDSDNVSIDPSHAGLVQTLYQYKTNFQKLRTYLHSIKDHFHRLAETVRQIEWNPILAAAIDPIPMRLIQMRVKLDQIDRLLHPSVAEKIDQELSPILLQLHLTNHYSDLICSIQLSMNQKSTLIDHLNNEHRYMKYYLNDYAAKLKHRQELLIKLTEQFSKSFLHEYQRKTPKNFQSIHEHQREEFLQLLAEYEQVRAENDRLKEETEEKLRKFSLSIRSNSSTIE